MGDIAISNGVRSNLMALQNTAKMMDVTQNRLATGNRVNSAMDNPANFFTASAMSNRASDLGNLMDSMKTGVNTLKAADAAMTAITKLVESAQGTARQALQDASGIKSASAESAAGLNGSTTKAAAEATTAADAGFTDASTLTIATKNNGVTSSVDITITGTDTMKDVVKDINEKLGSNGKASIGEDGKLKIEASDGGDLTMTSTTAADVAAVFGGAVVSGTTIAAPASEANETREKLADQFNDMMKQITDLAEDADFNGINLLKGDDLKVTFNEKTGANENSLTIKGVGMDAQGLGFTESTGKFQTDAEITSKLDQVKEALTSLRTQASEFGSNLATVQTRQDFTTAMIDTLEKGSSDLTLADTNKEGANMLALQTRQQLAGKTMGIAAQADKAILSFLR